MSLRSARESVGWLIAATFEAQGWIPVYGWEVCRAKLRGTNLGQLDEPPAKLLAQLPEGLTLVKPRVAEAMEQHDHGDTQPTPDLAFDRPKAWSVDEAQARAKRTRDTEGLAEAYELFEMIAGGAK